MFTRVGRLPAPIRARLQPEGIVHVAERVRVRQRFSGSVPGMVSSWGGVAGLQRAPEYVFHMLGVRVKK